MKIKQHRTFAQLLMSAAIVLSLLLMSNPLQSQQHQYRFYIDLQTYLQIWGWGNVTLDVKVNNVTVLTDITYNDCERYYFSAAVGDVIRTHLYIPTEYYSGNPPDPPLDILSYTIRNEVSEVVASSGPGSYWGPPDIEYTVPQPTFLDSYFDGCSVLIEMESAGFGWQGGYLKLYADGELLYDNIAPPATGFYYVASYDVPPNCELRVTYVPGQNPGFQSFSIIDPVNLASFKHSCPNDNFTFIGYTSDRAAPVPDVQSLPVITGECSASVTSTPTATDACGATYTATTNDPLTYSAQGTHTVHWTFSNQWFTVSQEQTVIVDDVTAPVPDASELPAVYGMNGVTLTTVPTATDNCVGAVQGGTDQTTFNTPGVHTAIWHYADGNGNETQQSQTVVVGYSPLSVDAGDDQTIRLGYDPSTVTLTAQAAGGYGSNYTYSWGAAGSTQSITVAPAATTTYTVTASDGYGQVSDDVTVTVLDWRCGNNQNKVMLCHNGHTICVAPEAVEAHLAHGDSYGACAVQKRVHLSPTSFTLDQNHPNPFNPTTMIAYGIPQEGRVRLRVLDLLGREVAVLVNDTELAGIHKAVFDGTDYPSGTYIYQLEWNGMVLTRRMTLLK